MPQKAEVVRAMPRAGMIITWAAWMPTIAGLAEQVRAVFISPLTAGMVYLWRFTTLNPLIESCAHAALPSFLPQTQTDDVILEANLKTQRILHAVRSGAAPESGGELHQAGSAAQCDQSRIEPPCWHWSINWRRRAPQS